MTPLSQVDEAFRLQQKHIELTKARAKILSDSNVYIPEWRLTIQDGNDPEGAAFRAIRNTVIQYLNSRIVDIEALLTALEIDVNT